MCIPVNTIVKISCTATGTSVKGPYGASTLWDHTTYGSASGYVPDAEVYTGKATAVAKACAKAATGHVIMSPCLNMRSGPSTAATVVTCVPVNTMLTITCTTTGTAVTGPYGTTKIWDHAAYLGKSGYLSDAYIYTGTGAAVAKTC